MLNLEYNSPLYQLMDLSEEMISKLEAYFESPCICSCMDFITELLVQTHETATDFMDAIMSYRHSVADGQIRNLLIYDHYAVDTIIRSFEILAKNNPCEDASKNCDASVLMAHIYATACWVNSDIAYIVNKVNQSPIPTPISGNTIRSCGSLNNDSKKEELTAIIKLVKDAQRLTLLLFDILDIPSATVSQGLINAILTCLTKAAEALEEFVNDIDSNDFNCNGCLNKVSLDEALHMLKGLTFTMEYHSKIPKQDPCGLSHQRSEVMAKGYTPVYTKLNRALKGLK